MADYYTKFSFILSLPDEAAQKHALDLDSQARRSQFDDEPDNDVPASLVEAVEDWSFETEAESSPDNWEIWLHSESGGVDAVCAFIQYLLLTFAPEDRLTFEWSNDCSSPRLNAYGGGAAVITAKKIQTMSTSQWLDNLL